MLGSTQISQTPHTHESPEIQPNRNSGPQEAIEMQEPHESVKLPIASEATETAPKQQSQAMKIAKKIGNGWCHGLTACVGATIEVMGGIVYATREKPIYHDDGTQTQPDPKASEITAYVAFAVGGVLILPWATTKVVKLVQNLSGSGNAPVNASPSTNRDATSMA